MTEQKLIDKLVEQVKYIKLSTMSPEWHVYQSLVLIKKALPELAKEDGYAKLDLIEKQIWKSYYIAPINKKKVINGIRQFFKMPLLP